MPAWAATLVGVGVGGIIAYLNSLYIETVRRRRRARRDRRAALTTYLGRLYVVVGFMTQWPEELPPSALARFRASTVERSRRVRTHDWIRAQQRLREVFGESLYTPLFRFVEASAPLQVLELDEDVHEAVANANAYMERLARDRSEGVLDEWPRVRRRLLDAIAASGDGAVLEAAKAARTALPPD